MTTIPRNDVLVLVVDDQLDRQRTYAECLDSANKVLQGKWKLDVRFCSDLASTVAVVREPGQAALAIVDMVLDAEGWSAKDMSLLDERLVSEGWPMLLVSARFDEDAAFDRANRLLAGNTSRAVPSQFLLWSTIEQAAKMQIVANQLAFIINSVLSRANERDVRFAKAASDPVDLLHITDAHFGKASWNAGALMLLRAKLNSAGLVAADFLALTGDVADQGTPPQYQAAATYLRAIAHNGLVVSSNAELPLDRVFVCPGNHDFSRPLALAANMTSTKRVGAKIQPGNDWMRNAAWTPYYDFEAEIAGHSRPWIQEPGYRLNIRFANAGILFLELNVERFAIDGHQPGFADMELQSRFNAAAAAVTRQRLRGECLVVLTHRHETDGWSLLAQMLDPLLSGLASTGPVVLLCGHDHVSRVSPEYSERVLVVRGVPPTTGPSRPDRVLPMVHFVRLLRRGGSVVGIEVRAFHQERSAWLDSDNARRFEWKERDGWCKSTTP